MLQWCMAKQTKLVSNAALVLARMQQGAGTGRPRHELLEPGTKAGGLTILRALTRLPYQPQRYVCECPACGARMVRGVSHKEKVWSCPGCLGAQRRGPWWMRKLRQAYRNMTRRCEDEDDPGYPHYGGRGICVCRAWLESFEQFAEDMGAPPSPAHSIDRKDNDGDYEPENCRWATRSQQGRNTRVNRRLTFEGKTMSLAGWCEELGMPRSALTARLDARGWGLARALTTPYQGVRRGSSHGRAKLQLEDVRWARFALGRLGSKVVEVARALGVCTKTTSQIRDWEIWRDVRTPCIQLVVSS